jgi:ATP-dependent Clp protease ATP-binding subunit ClpX
MSPTNNEIFLNIEKRLERLEKRTELHCSFCGKSEKDVSILIINVIGNSICNECLDVCNKIIEEKKNEEQPNEPI